MGAVDAVGPHVLRVALEARACGAVPEVEECRHTVAEPLARAVARAQDVAAPVGRVRDDAQSVLHLMHNGTRALVAGVGTHVHPRVVLVVAVGRRRAGAVAHAEVLRDAGQVVEDVAGLRQRVVDALVGCCVAAVVVRVGDVTLGHGRELDDVAVARLAVLVGGVGAHVVHGARLQVLEVVDGGAALRHRLRAQCVVDGRLCLLAQTEALGLDAGTAVARQLLDASESHCGTACVAGVGHHLGCLCLRLQAECCE